MAKKKGQRKDEWEYHWRHKDFDFALFLVIIGLVWLARDLGYIANVSIIPLVLVLFGSWLILKRIV